MFRHTLCCDLAVFVGVNTAALPSAYVAPSDSNGPLRTFDLQSFAALQLPQSRRSFIAQHFGYPKLGLKGKNEDITVFYECPLGNGRRNGFIPEDRIVEVKIRQQPKKQISPKCYLVGSPMCAHTLTSRLLTQRVSEKG